MSDAAASLHVEVDAFRRHVAAKRPGMQAIAAPGVHESVVWIQRGDEWSAGVICRGGAHADRAELYAVGYNEAAAR